MVVRWNLAHDGCIMTIDDWRQQQALVIRMLFSLTGRWTWKQWNVRVVYETRKHTTGNANVGNSRFSMCTHGHNLCVEIENLELPRYQLCFHWWHRRLSAIMTTYGDIDDGTVGVITAFSVRCISTTSCTCFFTIVEPGIIWRNHVPLPRQYDSTKIVKCVDPTIGFLSTEKIKNNLDVSFMNNSSFFFIITNDGNIYFS